MYIEITKEAFWQLVENDENTWSDYTSNELTESSHYVAYGVNIKTVTNFINNITQYYIEDINA